MNFLSYLDVTRIMEEGDNCPECNIGTMHVGGYVHDKVRVGTATFHGWEKEREYVCDYAACGKKMRTIEKSFDIRPLFRK